MSQLHRCYSLVVSDLTHSGKQRLPQLRKRGHAHVRPVDRPLVLSTSLLVKEDVGVVQDEVNLSDTHSGWTRRVFGGCNARSRVPPFSNGFCQKCARQSLLPIQPLSASTSDRVGLCNGARHTARMRGGRLFAHDAKGVMPRMVSTVYAAQLPHCAFFPSWLILLRTNRSRGHLTTCTISSIGLCPFTPDRLPLKRRQ